MRSLILIKTNTLLLAVGCRKRPLITSVLMCYTCVTTLIFRRRGSKGFHLRSVVSDGRGRTCEGHNDWHPEGLVVNYDSLVSVDEIWLLYVNYTRKQKKRNQNRS